MSYNPDDLGLDLLHAAALPECTACRKKSDGAKVIGGITFCSTHADAYWRQSNVTGGYRIPADFAANLRATTYKACWEAVPE